MSDEKISSYHLIMSKTNKYLSLHKTFKTCDKFSLKIDKTKTHILLYESVLYIYIHLRHNKCFTNTLIYGGI